MDETNEKSINDKTLKELLGEMNENLKGNIPQKKERKPFNSEGILLGLFIGIIAGGFAGLFTWLLAGIEIAIFVGGFVAVFFLFGTVMYKRTPFWFPIRARVGRPKQNKNWISIMKINDNRRITFEKQQIVEGTILVDDTPRVVTPDDILVYKRRQMIILPSWSIEPFRPEVNYDKVVMENKTTQGYRLLLNRMKSEVIKPKRSFSTIWIFGIIILIIAVGYMAFKGGWFK